MKLRKDEREALKAETMQCQRCKHAALFHGDPYCDEGPCRIANCKCLGDGGYEARDPVVRARDKRARAIIEKVFKKKLAQSVCEAKRANRIVAAHRREFERDLIDGRLQGGFYGPRK